MKKISLFVIISATILAIGLSGCASLGMEQYWPLSKRLLSTNSLIKKAAVAEFVDATDQQKKKTVLEIIEMFAMEENEAKRKQMLDTLLDLKIGAYAVIPLVKAVGENVNITSVDDVVDVIMKLKPSRQDMRELGIMLMKSSGAVKKVILGILGMK